MSVISEVSREAILARLRRVTRSIASSNADCVFGVARLISSASRMLVWIGPF